MVTLKDIAERVGVSITTVSRVLNGKGSISQETKDKVFQVMRELNYYPNEMARSLVNKNSHIIGLIVPYIDHPFFSALTAAIEEASSHAGYQALPVHFRRQPRAGTGAVRRPPGQQCGRGSGVHRGTVTIWMSCSTGGISPW